MAHQLCTLSECLQKFPFGLRVEGIKDAVPIRSYEELPDGVRVLILDCADWKALQALPKVLKFNNELYGRTGWNSDSHVAFFRTDANIAFAQG